MFNLRESRIIQAIVHKTDIEDNGGLQLSNEVLNLSDDELKYVLTNYFLDAFKIPEFYSFYPVDGELRNNKVCASASDIFSDASFFYAQSLHLAKYYSEMGPMKPGLLFIIHMEVSDQANTYEAIGVYRAEEKETFLRTEKENWQTNLEYLQGYNLQKPDKACLILNMHQNTGFKMCIYEKGSRGPWKDLFLRVKPFEDNFHYTRQMMEVTKDFVTKELTRDFEVSKSDQIDLLNKSVEYFKFNEKFDEEEFSQSVFGDNEVIGSFKKYKEEVQTDNDFSFEEAFDISAPAVKKQARIFKSVLKLDRNFHIYIHGNKEMIEKGVDENGKKYYKIFYEVES